MLTDEEIEQILPNIILNPMEIFEYKDDIQTFDKIIHRLFNKSRLGYCINTLDNQIEDNNEINHDDLQLLYDISYIYIPRKMNERVSDEVIQKTSEKTISRLIISQNNSYYNAYDTVPEIINKRFDLYPWQTYSSETLEKLYVNSNENLYIFKEIVGLLNKDGVIKCYDLTNDYDKKIMIVDWIFKSFDEENVNAIRKKISEDFIKHPNFLKYYDEKLDKFTLIAIIGRAIKNNKFEEIKNILLSKNISEKIIKTIAKLFELSYNHDLDSEIVFDD